ncbi:TLD-domain-containing protein [Microdochium trichocladiopsis]|uniref:Restriction of telomere capping protein 5 n=1 Tax=Microdochium trichocladiopsis TaxID=1682393 RepID=A0A9P8XUX1_9PEZI|nr:TLD-domain-containing protein [Microdochium trichocladiopsis]KAH7018356.1 TLD-domain-containing protein [Microdochium trichocladiopsis]
MGQAQSDHRPPPSRQHVAQDLAERFARKCFDPIELYTFKTNFRALADHQSQVRYLKEDTLARFLELPDSLGVSPIIFQMISYIGAFPFLDDAPAVLGFEQMIMVVTIMTERYKKILSRAAANRHRLLFKSLAVYDRKLSEIERAPKEVSSTDPRGAELVQNYTPGFVIDEAGDDSDDADEDDELVIAALDSLDIDEAFKKGDGHSASTHGAMIPADNLRKLIMLLLLVAPMSSLESLSTYADRLVGEQLESLGSTADDILASFINVEKSPGVTFAHFVDALPVNFPHLFSGLSPLFEHFLFSKELDLSKRKDPAGPPRGSVPGPHDISLPQASLLKDTGRIMNLNVLSQLSFFIPGNDLFHRLRLLYSGASDGYSMGSFESKVFNWRAPTLLLVSGTRITPGNKPSGSQLAFESTIPPRRYPDDPQQGHRDRVVFGLLVKEPWQLSSKTCFGGEGTVFFQLSPVHDVFAPSSLNHNYVSFTRSPSPNPGISVGCAPPGLGSTSRSAPLRSLGSVSLALDSSFEFGVFNHDYTTRGGAFASSTIRRYDLQTRFQVDDIEVWGCGGDEDAKVQRERWEWERREAEARRRINLGTGDIDADRQLLEMAGLIGQNRSGGST